MPASTDKPSIPFAGTVTDSLELMKKAWGMSGLPTIPSPSSMAQFAQNLPTMIVPTLDVGELDKRITDLRAVEQWLNLNTSLLRTTIQSLEVQRNTIATLKTFSGNMLNAMPGAGLRAGHVEPKLASSVAPPSPAPAAPAAHAGGSRPRKSTRKGSSKPTATIPFGPAVWWGALQDQFAKVAAAAAEAAPHSTDAKKKAAPRKRSSRKSS